MTNLTRNQPRRTRGDLKIGSMPAPTSAATTLFIGAAVQENAGQLENLTGAGTLFAGFLTEQATGNGAIDDNKDMKGTGKTNYVAKALDEVLANKPVTTAETKPYGCTVKFGS
jgi:hypothetical protein